MDIKPVIRTLFGLILFITFVKVAFQISLLAGLSFIFWSVLSFYSGEVSERPGEIIINFMDEALSSVF